MITKRLLLTMVLFAPAVAGADTTPSTPVEELDQGILAVMRAARTTSFAERMQMLTPVVQSSYDLPRIVRSSVGAQFANFPPAAQTELLDAITRLTVASYVANFNDFDGERFEILPATRHVGNDQVVGTRLLVKSGEPVKIDYVVHQDNNAWRIVDVLLNGSISRVAVQRSDFRSLLAGGNPAPLIASLRNKVARLEAGDTG